MNPEEINITIAEHCGWKFSEYPGAWGDAPCNGWVSPDGTHAVQDVEDLPDYYNDLNAMHLAELSLSVLRRGDYIEALNQITECRFDFHCAAAAQRAEAFLRTVRKWKEAE